MSLIRAGPVGGSLTAETERVAVIIKLRRLRMTAAEIAETPAMPLKTIRATSSEPWPKEGSLGQFPTRFRPTRGLQASPNSPRFMTAPIT